MQYLANLSVHTDVTILHSRNMFDVKSLLLPVFLVSALIVGVCCDIASRLKSLLPRRY